MHDRIDRSEAGDEPPWARLGVVAEVHDALPGSPAAAWHNPYPSDYAKGLLGPALARLQADGVDSIVLLGDLTHFGDAETQSGVIDAVTATGLPVLLVPGNHDVAKERGGLARFAESITVPGVGVAPVKQSLIPGVQAALLAIDYDPASGRHRSAGFDDADLAGEDLLIVFSHFPVLPMAEQLEAAGFAHAGDLTDRAAVADIILNRTGPTVVVHGHLHVRAAIAEGSVLQLSSAALIEPPHEVAVLEVRVDERGRPIVCRSVASVSQFDAERVPVLSPDLQEWAFADREWRLDPAKA